MSVLAPEVDETAPGSRIEAVGLQDFRCAAFAALLTTFESCGLRHCLLSGHEEWPARIDSDIDFMVAPEDLARVPDLLATAGGIVGARLVQSIGHERGATWAVLARCERSGPRLLQFQADVCGDYRRGGRLWMRAAPVLARRVRNRAGLWVAAPDDAWCYYLIKRIDKGVIAAAHAQRLQARFMAHPAACAARTQRLLGDDVGLIEAAVVTGSWDAVRARLPQLRWRMRRRAALREEAGTGPWRDALLHFFARWTRLMHPTGFMVVVLGPDGCGKSTAAAALAAALAPLFRRVVTRHLRWPVLPGSRSGTAGRAVVDPYARAPRSLPAALAKLLWFWLDYALAGTLHLAPARVRSTLVVFDRYYHDLLADPRRYRHPDHPLTMRVVRWLGSRVPQPDLVFVLDAPVAALQARKREVTAAECARQRQAYLHLVRAWPHATRARGAPELRVIDASASAAAVQAALLEHTLDVLAARQHARAHRAAPD